ncbi:Bax inhibitor-1/YccA family protein [Solicola gregarius]|uniref:Bax inhibitor-1/YccA family protein n=1 Tax=Solicola gregarius TaxID=2908642 RepID=A0AA46TKC0_9ACTN|nr:Bax inhibitor-1/YccA family protein [Solicola gregarius]UYM06467.1 Bax inhibitor-1/YccA family protein [Solicola gregarius]
MQSNNPVFARSDGFNGRSAQSTPGYTDPSSWSLDLGDHGAPPQIQPMTVETVVQKTAITLTVAALAAFATWWFIGPLVDGADVDQDAVNLTYMLAMGGAIAGFALAMVNSFKRVISPPLVIAYAVVEGVFIGAFSKMIVSFIGGDSSIVLQAVLGTIAAFAGTLTVYKVFNIKVTEKFRRGVMAALFGFVALALLNFVMSLFGADFGFRDFDTFGLLVSCAAVVIGVLCLILDFDFVERGVAAGLPESESWRAAFGLTVTLVWIYIEMLRIAAIFAGND